MENTALHIDIKGMVQGVGFRPFIVRHARKYGLNGWVRNDTGGIVIHIEGPEDKCNAFTSTLSSEAPGPSCLTDILVKGTHSGKLSGFSIHSSLDEHEDITDISPDISVCDLCLGDMKTQARRHRYPFTNCTHCGPRFSIITDIPYDRRNTAMNAFTMCNECAGEYISISDRRYHAQPVSCHECGPEYTWSEKGEDSLTFEQAMERVAGFIEDGKILLLKSMTGFQLICDARNERAIHHIRELKQRRSKPLAVMFQNLGTLLEYAVADAQELRELESWRKPIVLLRQKKGLSPEVNRGYPTIGAMLPYSPVHHMIMEQVDTPAIVFTSANLKGQPLIGDNNNAIQFLRSGYCDAILKHNMAIQHKQDDSIVRIINKKPVILRRARGFVPEPVNLKHIVEGILATGADLKNAFCIGKGTRAIMSHYTGDLGSYDVYVVLRKSIEEFMQLYRFKAKMIACDSHPDYYSTRYAEKMRNASESYGHPELVYVQHHHAHIASVMAEHQIDEKVIGIAMDGTGYGEDGKLWGSEFMLADLAGYKRCIHLDYLPLPGGEIAIREPWRMATAILYLLFGEESLNMPLEFCKRIEPAKRTHIIRSIKNGVNVHESCGMGRLFDVVASLLNLTHVAEFDGEGPVKLENIISDSNRSYSFKLENSTFSYSDMIRQVVKDQIDQVQTAEIAATFHNTIVDLISTGVNHLYESSGIKKVILSGGTFQNAYITHHAFERLVRSGFDVYINEKVPVNDGGVALGQLVIASKKMKSCA